MFKVEGETGVGETNQKSEGVACLREIFSGEFK